MSASGALVALEAVIPAGSPEPSPAQDRRQIGIIVGRVDTDGDDAGCAVNAMGISVKIHPPRRWSRQLVVR